MSTKTPPVLTLAQVTRAAALACNAYQADADSVSLKTMQDAVDRALDLGATYADILAAR